MPTWKNVDDLRKQADETLNILKQKAVILGDPSYVAQVASLEGMLTEVKRKIEVVHSPPQAADETTWLQRPEKERVGLYREIRRIVSFLRSMNLDEIAVGWCYFGLFTFILVVLVGAYLYGHSLPQKVKSVDAKVSEVKGLLSQMDTHIQKLKAQPLAPDAKEAKDALTRLSDALQNKLLGGLTSQTVLLLDSVRTEINKEINQDQIAKTETTFNNFRKNLEPELEALRHSGTMGTEAKVLEVVGLLSQMDTHTQKLKAQPPTPDAKEAKEAKEAEDALTRLSDALQNKLLGIGLTFQTLRLLGDVRAESETHRIAKTETFSNFRKNLIPELESLSVGYFWATTPWRWLEIAWWAEFGTLVGLLFYISGLLGTGLFRVEETSMFWPEVCITPLVVIVVFFLFSYTGITNLQPGEVSITVNLGFAFILGFAIRRTIGFLDIIKKRLLPDPEPTRRPTL